MLRRLLGVLGLAPVQPNDLTVAVIESLTDEVHRQAHPVWEAGCGRCRADRYHADNSVGR